MNIDRGDGTVIAWGGTFGGPGAILNPIGTPSGYSNYKTCIGVNGDLRDMIVRVPDSALSLLGEAVTERCVAAWFENYCADKQKTVPQHQEHWTLTLQELEAFRPR